MLNSKGFTLIELIIVIVILGILASTAVPKFINFEADARTAVLQSVKSSMEAVTALVHGKSLIKGNQNQASDIVTLQDGSSVSIEYGYPSEDVGQWSTLLNLGEDFTIVSGIAGGVFYIYFKGDHFPFPDGSEDCLLSYIPATSSQKYTIKFNECT